MRRNCIVCQSRNTKTIFRNSLAILDELDLSYTISSCQNCGAVFASELAGEKEINDYYKEYSKYDIYRSIESVPAIYDELSGLTLSAIKASGIKPARVFDIGSSFGTFLNDVRKEFHCEVKGIDPAPNARINARAIYDLEVETDFYTGNEYLAQYDLVSVNSVLEHIINVHKFVADISNYSAENSHLVITVPSADDFAVTDCEWLGEFSNEHINFFSEKSLNDLMSQYNYATIFSTRKRIANGQYVLVSIFKKKTVPRKESTFLPYTTTELSIQTYIKNSQRILSRIHSQAAPLEKTEYAIWGAGSHTQKLLNQEFFKNHPPVTIIDSNDVLRGSSLNKIGIVHPSEIEDLNKFDSILISSYNAQGPIMKALKAKGYHGNIATIY